MLTLSGFLRNPELCLDSFLTMIVIIVVISSFHFSFFCQSDQKQRKNHLFIFCIKNLNFAWKWELFFRFWSKWPKNKKRNESDNKLPNFIYSNLDDSEVDNCAYKVWNLNWTGSGLTGLVKDLLRYGRNTSPDLIL